MILDRKLLTTRLSAGVHSTCGKENGQKVDRKKE